MIEITVLGEIRAPKVITVDKRPQYIIGNDSPFIGLNFYTNIKDIKILRQEKKHI